jgi:hypothetical protein
MSCVSTKVIVNKNPEIISLKASSPGNCPGAKSMITVEGYPGNSGVWKLYEGSCGENPVASVSTGLFEVSPEKTTTYFVSATGACASLNNCAPVTIQRSLINPQIIQDAGVLSSVETAAQFEWYDCNSDVAIPGAANASFAPAQSGQFRLRIQKDGCEVFTDCVDFIIASFDKEINMPHVFPNPVSDLLRVVLPGSPESAVITVSDLSGREFISEKSDSGTNLMVLKTDHLPAGIYIVRVRSRFNIFTTKIIKK